MTSQTYLHLDHAAEILQDGQPTGEFAEVTEGKVVDYGGNTLYGPAHPFACVKRATGFRRPYRLVPTKTQRVELPVSGADTLWTSVDSTEVK